MCKLLHNHLKSMELNMNILHTTLTGVDEQTSLIRLEEISKNYNVEWGVLYTESTSPKLGGNRYPSKHWFEKNITNFARIREENETKFSLHVCGSAIKRLLNQESSYLLDLISSFDRVQLNLRYKRGDLEKLEALFNNYPKINFITQHNNANKDLWFLIQAKNHNVLFDNSGGRGILDTNWQEPLSEKIYGYAGGLSPDNITEELNKIITVTKNKHFWVDMEGHIRTNDYLDLEKCNAVLNSISLLTKKNMAIKIG